MQTLSSFQICCICWEISEFEPSRVGGSNPPLSATLILLGLFQKRGSVTTPSNNKFTLVWGCLPVSWRSKFLFILTCLMSTLTVAKWKSQTPFTQRRPTAGLFWTISLKRLPLICCEKHLKPSLKISDFFFSCNRHGKWFEQCQPIFTMARFATKSKYNEHRHVTISHTKSIFLRTCRRAGILHDSSRGAN